MKYHVNDTSYIKGEYSCQADALSWPYKGVSDGELEKYLVTVRIIKMCEKKAITIYKGYEPDKARTPIKLYTHRL